MPTNLSLSPPATRGLAPYATIQRQRSGARQQRWPQHRADGIDDAMAIIPIGCWNDPILRPIRAGTSSMRLNNGSLADACRSIG
jgi:hypothetical protein